MKVVQVDGPYTYVSSLCLAVGDIVVAPFGGGEAYLQVCDIADSLSEVGSEWEGPLEQVSRFATSAESEAFHAVTEAYAALDTAQAALEQAAKDATDPTPEEARRSRHANSLFIRVPEGRSESTSVRCRSHIAHVPVQS